MYLLDTGHLTILERGGHDTQPLVARLSSINPNEVVATTIITSSTFKSLKKTYPRLGSMDLKIAAIAIANNATLLTRNLSDFSQIKGLKIEDWTIYL